MPRKGTTEQFICRSKLKFNKRFSYEDVIYLGSDRKVLLTCVVCGTAFSITPHSHFRSGSQGGCPVCHNMNRGASQRATKEGFIEKAQKIHGDAYEYSEVVYVNNHSKVCIFCRKHKKYFSVTPDGHLTGAGCPICYGERLSELYRSTKEEFILKAIEVHGTKYDYSKVVYKNNRTKIEIICSTHGSFWQTPTNHLSGDTCPHCALLMRSGSNHYAYKDGDYLIRERLRRSKESLKWIKLVKYNIEYCDCCGIRFHKGLFKYAHHLNSWCDHPDERFVVSNGVCLCEDCHKRFHSKYGSGNNTKLQYEEFKVLE